MVQLTLQESGNPTILCNGLSGMVITLNSCVEQAPSDRIPKDSLLCIVRLNRTVRIRKVRDICRYILVVSVYTHTDTSSDEVKEKFYRKLFNVLHKANIFKVVLVARVLMPK